MAMAIRRCKLGAAGKSAAPLTVRTLAGAASPKAADFTLPGKTSKESVRCPYHKPTQVDEMNILRRSGDGLFRN